MDQASMESLYRTYGSMVLRQRKIWKSFGAGLCSTSISNTDDHLRNHGFLYAGQDGWRLSPAYDLNPVPVDIKPRILTTTINEDDGTASLDLAISVAEYFELEKDEAKAIAAEVGNAVSTWRNEAARHGVTKSEIDRMATAFEHDDLKKAQEIDCETYVPTTRRSRPLLFAARPIDIYFLMKHVCWRRM